VADEGAEVQDASRRTELASERTYMAWVRGGLAAFAVGLGAGKLVPELSTGAAWPFEIVGAAFIVLGVAFVAYGLIRHRNIASALARGVHAPADERALLALTVVTAALGLLTIVLVVAT
jgi:putative membrane protein